MAEGRKKIDKKIKNSFSRSEGWSFLFKPVFFIFSLTCASWLVLKIEQLSPSDFGKYKSLFESTEKKKDEKKFNSEKKLQLKKIIKDYKNGKLDSAMFDLKVEEMMDGGGE